MIVFVAGAGSRATRRVDPDHGGRALRAFSASLPFFAGREPARWKSPSSSVAVAWVSHDPARIGGVDHVQRDAHRLALFCGRPIRWAGDGADGRGALDPATYLRPVEEWSGVLDGRGAVLRCFDDRLEAWTDALGAYPLYRADAHGAAWVSNSAQLLRLLHGGGEMDPVSLAGLLGGGWPLDGHPWWAAVRRLPRGSIVRIGGGAGNGPSVTTEHGPSLGELAALAGAGLDPAAAARDLVAATRALADWPGRPSLVPVTGGRDSRLVLAAALAAGFEFTAATGGAPEDPDVVAGAELCRAAGIEHGILPADPHGDVFSDPAGAARLLAVTTAGTASLGDAAGFPMGPREAPLALWHSGQGGEVARGYYGSAGDRDGLVELLFRRFTGRRPGRPDVLSPAGKRLIEERIAAFVDEALDAGAEAADVPDLFYLLRRMGTWAGPTHGAVEFVRDTTSPLWSRRMVAHELGLSADERAREHFHLRVLRELAPELVAVPFADGFSWSRRSAGPGRRIARARSLVVKALGELNRRTRRSSRAPAETHDPFGEVQRLVRAAAQQHPDHPAREVLDRARADELLTRRPAALDTMSRYYVWRMATVFLADAPEG